MRALGRLSRRPISDKDHHWRLGAPHRYTQQRAHAELLHAVQIENLAVEALFFGHCPRPRGQYRGSHTIGGLVHQLSGEILRFDEYLAPLARRFESAIAVRNHNSELVDNLNIFLVTLERVRLEIA